MKSRAVPERSATHDHGKRAPPSPPEAQHFFQKKREDINLSILWHNSKVRPTSQNENSAENQNWVCIERDRHNTKCTRTTCGRMTHDCQISLMALKHLCRTQGKKSEGCGENGKECGQSWPCQLCHGQRWLCHLCRRSRVRLVDTWSGGGTVPTCSSSSSEATGSPLKQAELIKAFRLRAGQMHNGADENLQPHLVCYTLQHCKTNVFQYQ